MLEITRAGVKDHGVVTGILIHVGRTLGWLPEVDRDRWDRVIAEHLGSDAWMFLVAYDSGEPVGIAVANFHLTLHGSRAVARLEALMVAEEKRGRGIGSELLKSVMTAAQRRGCREVEVPLDAGDEGTIRFYREAGFSKQRALMSWSCEESE